MLLIPLKQAIIRKNLLSLSKVMNNLVGACIAGNAKNMPNFTKEFLGNSCTEKTVLLSEHDLLPARFFML
jgi:hypothetical protein